MIYNNFTQTGNKTIGELYAKLAIVENSVNDFTEYVSETAVLFASLFDYYKFIRIKAIRTQLKKNIPDIESLYNSLQDLFDKLTMKNKNVPTSDFASNDFENEPLKDDKRNFRLTTRRYSTSNFLLQDERKPVYGIGNAIDYYVSYINDCFKIISAFLNKADASDNDQQEDTTMYICLAQINLINIVYILIHLEKYMTIIGGLLENFKESYNSNNYKEIFDKVRTVISNT